MSGKKSLWQMTSVRLQDGKGLLGMAMIVGPYVRGVGLTQAAGLGTPIIDRIHGFAHVR